MATKMASSNSYALVNLSLRPRLYNHGLAGYVDHHTIRTEVSLLSEAILISKGRGRRILYHQDQGR